MVTMGNYMNLPNPLLNPYASASSPPSTTASLNGAMLAAAQQVGLFNGQIPGMQQQPGLGSPAIPYAAMNQMPMNQMPMNQMPMMPMNQMPMNQMPMMPMNQMPMSQMPMVPMNQMPMNQMPMMNNSVTNNLTLNNLYAQSAPAPQTSAGGASYGNYSQQQVPNYSPPITPPPNTQSPVPMQQSISNNVYAPVYMQLPANQQPPASNCPPPPAQDCPPPSTPDCPPASPPPAQPIIYAPQYNIVQMPPPNCEQPPACEQPPSSKQPPPEYNSGDVSRYWGDPHLEGFDGEKYDVMGKGGNIYNMLSDKNVQYNTTFVDWGKPGKDGVQPTVIGEAGIQVGSNMVQFDRSGAAPTVNGKSLTKGQKVDLGEDQYAKWDGNDLTVKTTEYTIDLTVKAKDKNGGYLDSSVKINEGVNPLADGVAAHGLLGQTADGVEGKRKGVDGNKNIEKQGGSVIDGVVNDYLVDGLWDNDFKYNRFSAPQQNVNPWNTNLGINSAGNTNQFAQAQQKLNTTSSNPGNNRSTSEQGDFLNQLLALLRSLMQGLNAPA